MATQHAPKAMGKPLWREIIETAGGAIFLSLIIMTFIARAFTVDGPSMQPTLRTGERLLIDKITYRFRPPARGDIVVFRYPADPSTYFIKRVIGVPGDRIDIRGGHVYVNDHALQEDYIETKTISGTRSTIVPHDHFFVLGDNRSNSQDSRSPSVGFVPRTLFVGRALLRYWPLHRASVFTRPELVQAAP